MSNSKVIANLCGNRVIQKLIPAVGNKCRASGNCILRLRAIGFSSSLIGLYSISTQSVKLFAIFPSLSFPCPLSIPCSLYPSSFIYSTPFPLLSSSMSWLFHRPSFVLFLFCNPSLKSLHSFSFLSSSCPPSLFLKCLRPSHHPLFHPVFSFTSSA